MSSVQSPRMFLSYSREDAEFAKRLYADLQSADVTVWMDQRDLQIGGRWDRDVQAALEHSTCLLVVLSPASISSENVLDEVSYALDKGKQVLPILYKDCDPPLRLRRLQQFDARAGYRTSDLLEGVCSQKEKNFRRPGILAAWLVLSFILLFAIVCAGVAVSTSYYRYYALLRLIVLIQSVIGRPDHSVLQQNFHSGTARLALRSLWRMDEALPCGFSYRERFAHSLRYSCADILNRLRHSYHSIECEC